MSMTTAQREAVVREARALVGAPFQHAGRDANGLDCIGLLVVATRRAGMEVHDNTDYSPVVNSAYLDGELRRAASEKHLGDPLLPGDVLLFRVGTSPQHVAMVSRIEGGNVDIVHSYQTVGRVVEQRLDETWRRRLVRAYEWRPS